MAFTLTYATMFDPPAELHDRYEDALGRVRAGLGARHGLLVAGEDRATSDWRAKASPIDDTLVLGEFAVGTTSDVEAAMAAGAAAFPAWRATPVEERVRLIRRLGDLIEERVFDLAAALSLEVGKNRMEALGEAYEVVDFCRIYAGDMESHGGYEYDLPPDPVPGVTSTNRSVMRPYGVWVVVAPFNYPFALAGGPVVAAMVTGNTVVLKGASDTPWAGRLLGECIRDAGIPDGVFSYLTGPGSTVGAALVDHQLAAGVTFTGSYDVGMGIARSSWSRPYPRPVIAEMGGKNPVVVTDRADLADAALGIARSGYGMGGQKCSALSRIFVHEAVADDLIERVRVLAEGFVIGDPTDRATYLGPVATRSGYNDYARYAEGLRADGARVVTGGEQLTDGDFGRGLYVRPTLAEAPESHPLWKEEMFNPILMVDRVASAEEGMRRANDTTLGLTAGFYGGPDEVEWFQEHIEAGVTYANRPQGATTGAWPGYQPFGGWKGSGTTGHAIASYYYLAQYLREQSRTVVVK